MRSNSSHNGPLIPPKLADRLLEWFCKHEWLEPIRGDLHEQYVFDRSQRRKLVADARYWINMLNFLRPFALKSYLHNSNTALMLKSHFKISWRNLKHQKMYTGINVFGLVLSTVICLNIAFYVSDELSYDKFHPEYENVHRITVSIKAAGGVYNEAGTQFPMAEALREDYPGIKKTVRLFKPLRDPLLIQGDRKYTEERFFLADPDFFTFFGYPLIAGSPEEALREPNSIVLSERMAEKYFGKEDPLGKLITYNDRQLLKVTGIVGESDLNSHIKFDFVSPLQFQLNQWQEVSGTEGRENKWYWTGAWTYLRFSDVTEKQKVLTDLPNFVLNHFPEKWRNESKLDLQRIDEIHLNSDLLYEIEPNGSLANIKIFSIIGLVLLSIAIINFVNLILAQSMDRAKQIGIAKNLGASRANVMGQVLTETILICLFSGFIGLFLSYLTVPYLNAITGKSIDPTAYFTVLNFFVYLLLFIGLGIVSGIYPSIYLSKIGKISAVNNNVGGGVSSSFVRELLVGIQFISSVILIISVIIINAQRDFIYSKNIGFDKENMLVVKARRDINQNFEAFKNELLKMSEVVNISGITEVPGEGMGSWRFVPEGGNRAEPVLMPHTSVGYDFVKTMNIEVASGRFFDKKFPADYNKAFVLNEEAVKSLGWGEDPIGKSLELFGPGTEKIIMKGQVVGILKDYHYESLHHPIKPAVFSLAPRFGNYVIKFRTDQFPNFIERVESVWAGFSEKWPLEYHLLDQKLAVQYSREEKLSQLINLAVAIALIIACIGIFGLSSFMIAKRTKEVGIRRVLGIRTSAIIMLLSRNFVIVVLIANVLAWPVAYIAMKGWLENFEYTVEIGWLAFLVATIITLVLSFAITSFHAIRVSKLNPVKSLRYE
ncbi:MAG: ABC transporter permease [Cyclobacteriaceae bacterium]